MKFKLILASIGLAATLGTGTASALDTLFYVQKEYCSKNPDARDCGPSGSGTARGVPEIDATSGTQAIALAVGLLLLGAERLRRRSSKQN
jgi:hypothetical protein